MKWLEVMLRSPLDGMLVHDRLIPSQGGDSHIKRTGVLVGNFEKNP